MRPWSTLRALFALAGIVSAPGARAAGPALHCVKTPADLLVALSAASSEDDVEVRVVAGIYPMPASFGLDYQGTGNARVSGGWDNYCVHQTPNTLLTLLQPVAGGQPIGALERSAGKIAKVIRRMLGMGRRRGIVPAE